MLRFVLDCSLIRPVDERAQAWFAAAQQRGWASPRAGYHEGKVSAALLEQATSSVAQLVAGDGGWFTGEPASAVQSAVQRLGAGGRFRTVVTSAVDSEVVHRGTATAAGMLGLPHHVVPVDGSGRLDPHALPSNAILVTHAANQEIGSMQSDLTQWRSATESALVLDAACAFGWMDLPQAWDAVLLDPRSWGAPAGAWPVVTRGTRAPGPGEFTDVPAAVAAGLAGERWHAQAPSARDTARGQIEAIRSRVLDQVPDVEVRGGQDGDLPHVLSISVLYVDGEALQTALDGAGYAVGSGSACASRAGEPSHVLAAVGALTSGNVRLGLPPDLPQEAVDGFLDALTASVRRLREQVGLA